MKQHKILSKRKCKKRFLFHSSSKNLKILDPRYCKKVNGKYEYKKPTIHAFDKITNEYCFEPVGGYKKVLKSGISWAHHKLKLKNRILFLGTKPKGYLYVLDGTQFCEIIREDFMQGEWVKAKEYVCYKKLKPIKKIKINKPIDVENIKEYEYLGSGQVGLMSPKKYLKLCKSNSVKKAIKKAMDKKFEPHIPKALKSYLQKENPLRELFGSLKLGDTEKLLREVREDFFVTGDKEFENFENVEFKKK